MADQLRCIRDLRKIIDEAADEYEFESQILSAREQALENVSNKNHPTKTRNLDLSLRSAIPCRRRNQSSLRPSNGFSECSTRAPDSIPSSPKDAGSVELVQPPNPIPSFPKDNGGSLDMKEDSRESKYQQRNCGNKSRKKNSSPLKSLHTKNTVVSACPVTSYLLSADCPHGVRV